jgi:hypothetical protein
MKRFLSWWLMGLVAACGTTTGGTDGGPNDASQSQDTASNDASSDTSSTDTGSNDAAPNDAESFGDGSLQAGANCDPNNNQCSAGLLCCSEPTHLPDAAFAYFCEKPVNKGCPMFP